MAAEIKLPYLPPSLDVFETERRAMNRSYRRDISPQDLAEIMVTRARAKGNARS